MNVYLYIKNFPAAGNPIVTGTIKAVHGLAVELVSCGVEVKVICEGQENSSVKTPAGYEIKCFDGKRGIFPLSLPEDLKSFFRNTYKQNTLVILNGIFNPPVYKLSRYLNSLEIGYIFAPHGIYHPETFKKNRHFKWPYWYFFEKYMLNRAKTIQLLDCNGTEYLRKLGVLTPVIQIENGFFDNEVISADDLIWKDNEVIQILFFGRIDIHTKALDILLEAISRIRNSTKFHLTIQGPDWGNEKRKLIKQISRLKIKELISLKDPEYCLAPTEVIATYDIFCMPSRHEGFGLSALEAMVAARVLLVSNTTGIATHVAASGCGVVVEPEVCSIMEGFETLFKQRNLWQQMGMQGREYALNTLQWSSIAKRAVVEYQRLIRQQL